MQLNTKEQLIRHKRKALADLINMVGGPVHLSAMLDLSPSTVASWVERGQISKNGARIVGRHPTLGFKFTAESLRPDMYYRINGDNE